MANVKTLAKELDFRTGGATRCQKLTGGTHATRSNGRPAIYFYKKFFRKPHLTF